MREARTSGRRRRRAAVLILLVGSVVVAPATWLLWLSRRYHDEQRLLAAVEAGDPRTMRALLAQGVSPDAEQIRLDYTYTSPRLRPLLGRAPRTVLRYVVVPLHRRLRVETSSMPALRLAILRGGPETAVLLIDHGADPNSRDAHGQTPLHWVCRTPCVDVLVPQPDGSVRRRVVQAGSGSSVVERLLAHGADIQARDERGVTPLHAAVAFGGTDVLQALLDAGADPDARDNRGQTPVHWAADLNRPRHLERLLARGADVQARDESGLTPLHVALRGTEAMQALLDAGADPDARDNGGQTPVHWAAQLYLPQHLELLLAHGADVNARDDRGITPLALAVGRVERILRGHGAEAD